MGECEVCGYDGPFDVRDGFYYCTNCQTQSQELGRETRVDEETLGQFSGAAGEGRGPASALQRRSLRKSKSSQSALERLLKKVDPKADSAVFTTIEAYTFIVRGWIEILVEDLNLNIEVKTMAESIWMRYLQASKRAFVDNPALGFNPKLRDVQVRLWQRRRILHPRKKASASLTTLRRKRALDEMSSAGDEESEEKARRVRKKSRKQFFKALEAESGDDANLDLDFSSGGESFASFTSASTAASSSLDASNTQNSSFSSLNLSSERTTSSGTNLDPDVVKELLLEDQHSAVLRNLTKFWDKKFEEKVNFMQFQHNVDLNSAFTCVALAVLCHEKNDLTLADVLWFAKTDALPFTTAAKLLPKSLKLFGCERMSFVRANPMSHKKLKEYLCKLCRKLDIQELNFGIHGTLKAVVERFCSDFCLPKVLAENVWERLKEAPVITDLKQFVPGECIKRPLLVVECRALALIVLALKSYFVLDDRIESRISKKAKKFNKSKKFPGEKYFNFDDWFKLSKMRLFLAVKHSHLLHDQFKELYSGVELTAKALKSRYEFEGDLIKAKRANQVVKKDQSAAVERPMMTFGLMAEKLKELRKEGGKTGGKGEIEYLRKSKTTLTDFTRYLLDSADVLDDEDDKKKLRRLLNMRKNKLEERVNQSGESPDENPVDSFRCSYLNQLVIRKSDVQEDEDEDLEVQTFPSEIPNDDDDSGRRIYWRTWTTAPQGVWAPNYGSYEPLFEDRIRAAVPENFLWLCEYFCAYAGLELNDLVTELMSVEEVVWKYHPTFFA